MDFRSRGGQQVPSTPAGSTSASSTNPTNKKRNFGQWLDRSSVLLLFCVAIIIAAVTGLTFFSGNGEGKAVKQDNYQAIFLNNGQVYFGSIKGLNQRFVDLRDIYYLQTSDNSGQQTSASSNTNVSLVKLGCELHAPFDQMVINREQVLFWENLKDDSQVVKAIAQYKKDNPDGQKCSEASQNSTQQAPSTSTQSNTTPNSNTNRQP